MGVRRLLRSQPQVRGAVAQLVARLVRIEKVRGSIPLSSTNPYLGSATRTPVPLLSRAQARLRQGRRGAGGGGSALVTSRLVLGCASRSPGSVVLNLPPADEHM